MNKFFKAAVVTFVLTYLFGCASTVKQTADETVLPEIDVVQVKENSEEALKLAQEAKIEIQTTNTKISDIDTKLISLSDQVSSVSLAKIEELENRLTLLTEAFKELYEKVAAIEVLPQIKIAKPKRTKPAVFSPNSATFITSSEYDAYQKALSVFDKRMFSEALKLFSDCINKFPNGDYSDKAQFWIGESYYALGNFGKAIASFNKVFAYKNSSKADDAQLKLALSYMRMGKNAVAVDEFKRLINRYPASEYVARAKKYLSEIRE